MESADRETLKERPRLSVREVASKHWKGLLACVGLVIATNVTYYMLLTYMPSYLLHNLHYSEDHGVLIIIAIMVGMLFVQPVVGMWSDKVGCKAFVIGGSIGLFILEIPCFSLINSNVLGLIFLGLLLNAFIGVMASTLPAMFPTQIRYSALAISFNISVLIAGLLSDGDCGNRVGDGSVHAGNGQPAAERRQAFRHRSGRSQGDPARGL